MNNDMNLVDLEQENATITNAFFRMDALLDELEEKMQHDLQNFYAKFEDNYQKHILECFDDITTDDFKDVTDTALLTLRASFTTAAATTGDSLPREVKPHLVAKRRVAHIHANVMKNLANNIQTVWNDRVSTQKEDADTSKLFERLK